MRADKGVKMKLTSSQKRELVRIALTVILTLAALIICNIFDIDGNLTELVLFLPAFLLGGYKVLKKAFSGIFRASFFDENVLMSIASICALALFECFEAVAIVLFASIGEMFEDTALARVHEKVSALACLCPDNVNVIRNGEEITIPASELLEGELYVVRPGERLCADGTVVSGSAGLDCSSLTGESKPLDVFEGDEVSSGCICLDGTLTVKALRRAENSRAAQIIALVEDSAMKKSSAEKFITRFSLKYTPTVVALAAVIAIFLPLFNVVTLREGIYSALCFLVISCPCALVISVPLTFFGAIGGGASRGILFKSNMALENMSKAKTVLFDKTGTLTNGVFAVANVICLENIGTRELLSYAYAAEKGSNHPLSKAVCDYARQNQAELSLEACDEKELRGKGRVVMCGGKRLLAGNLSLLGLYELQIPKALENVEKGGHSVIYIALDGKVIGAITLWDSPKNDSLEAVKELKEECFCDVVMLTGDNYASAKSVSDSLGIKFESSLLPENKLSYVTELSSKKSKKERVLFVGDGINDAPALSASDVGIAMGDIGSDAAIECADVVILGDSPLKVAKAIKLSRRAVLIARQNIIFALFVKLLVMVLSLFGIVGMFAAVFADVGVSVIAILNAMRALGFKK